MGLVQSEDRDEHGLSRCCIKSHDGYANEMFV